MIKVALISAGFSPVPAVKGGGVEQLCTALLNENEKKHDINFELFTIYDSNINPNCYNYTNINQIKINKIKQIIVKIVNKIMTALNINIFIDIYSKRCSKILNQKEEFDYIIIENNMFLFKTIKEHYKKNGTKFIFHLHNDIDDYYKPRRLCKYISKNSYKILAVSSYIKDRFIEITGKKDNVEVLYNCITMNNINYNFEDEYTNFKKMYNIQNDDILFLYCGRFSKEKGLIELIDAFNLIKDKHAKLIIIGNKNTNKILNYEFMDKYSSEVFKHSEKNKNILFAGYVENKLLKKFYDFCDVVVIPTICEEAFGLVAIEAMFCGKPLIVTNSGGMVELVDENCAIIVNKNNIVEELKNAMNMLLNNKKAIKLMGENAKNKVFERYSEEVYYREFLKKL